MIYDIIFKPVWFSMTGRYFLSIIFKKFRFIVAALDEVIDVKIDMPPDRNAAHYVVLLRS